MKNEQSPDEIRKVAADFDKAVENKDIERILSSFADDCEIELLGQRLVGKEGVQKWISWLYNGTEIKSKQAEVLLYENYKIKSLRLYFDRLDFAEAVTRGPVSQALVRRLINKSLEGLV